MMLHKSLHSKHSIIKMDYCGCLLYQHNDVRHIVNVYMNCIQGTCMFFDYLIKSFNCSPVQDVMQVYNIEDIFLPPNEPIYTRLVFDSFEKKRIVIKYNNDNSNCFHSQANNIMVESYGKNNVFNSPIEFCKYVQDNCVIRISKHKLNEQLSRLEDRLHIIEMKQQDDTESDTSSAETDDDEGFTLTPDNIVRLSIQFHKARKLSNADIVETIQLMLGSRMYKLGREITQNKIDFAEANTLFLAGVAPTKLEKNDLQNLIFKNVVCDNLI